ncbi:MAG: ABC transporter ATP-binding protein [Halodesulfurarchaeum sp.]
MSLTLEDVRATVGAFEIGPLSTTFDPGVTVVLGPSGSGKSTLLSLIAGFASPAAGTITLDGRRIDDRPPEDRDVGMVFQHFALFPHLSVAENLAFGAAPDRDVREVAAFLEIESLLDRDPGTLSGGEKQRVALARALVSDPSVLLLDEPLASLDAPIRERLRLELRDILAGVDIPVVYVTHDRDEAAVLGDRLVVLHDGEIVQEGPLEEVFRAPDTAFVADFLGMENVLDGRVLEVTDSKTRVAIGEAVWTVAGAPETIPSADESGGSREVSVAIHPDALEVSLVVGPEASADTSGETTDAPASGETDAPASGETDNQTTDATDAAASNQTKAPGQPDENVLQATVRRVITRHRDATVLLEGDSVGRLTATLRRDLAHDLEPGARVRVRIPPEDVHLTRQDA